MNLTHNNHINFGVGEVVGASKRLDILKKGYIPQDVSCSSIKALFHNTALYTVRRENHVGYTNILKWDEIQQRCYNRGVNASKAYFDYMMDYLPKGEKLNISS